MRTHRFPALRRRAFLAAAAALAAASTAAAQNVGVTRHDLQRHDLGIPGREALQTRVDFAPGGVAVRHRHPGEEIVYVLKGILLYELDGQPPRTLNPGDVMFIPAGTVHKVRNIGPGEASELATYVVEKDQPLVQPAD